MEGVNQRVLLVFLLGLVSLGLFNTIRERPPDPGLVNLAVRSTVFALPTATPRVIKVEVTRIVEIVRVVEVTRVVTMPQAAAATPLALPVSPTVNAPATVVPVAPTATALPSPTPQVLALITPSAPQIVEASSGCPAATGEAYPLIPVLGAVADHPDVEHGDLNLGLRGYVGVDAALGLVAISGPTDDDPPQLVSVLRRDGLPDFVAAYRVRDWDWGCGERGCRGAEISTVEVSALALGAQPGEVVYLPSRRAEVYGGGVTALVLYADPTRLTAVYTRDDSVAHGYAIHLDGLCVNSGLVQAYRQANVAGRGQLPAVRAGQAVGTAQGDRVIVAIRDRGAFKEPRSHKDWWQGR